MNVSNTIRQHYLFDRDQKRVSLAQFLRDSLSLLVDLHVFLTSGEISCIINLFAILLLFFDSLLVLCV